MRILLDECVDRHFARHIPGHEVESVQDIGLRSIKNGELLRRAQQRFDVFLTVDRNLAFQQPISKFDLAVVVRRARSNDIDALKPLVPRLLEALKSVRAGTVTIVVSEETKA